MSDVIQLVGRLGTAQSVAFSQVRQELGQSDPGKHILDYARQYITYVLCGGNRPAGTPTTALSGAVARAVELGLKQAYGNGSMLKSVNSNIRVRLSVLTPSREDIKQ